MRALTLKLLRDLLHLRGQAFAIGMVMACGVATFVMSLSTLDSLSTTLETYYARHRFADVFAHCRRAPLHVAERIRSIPGVATVTPRIVERVSLDMPDLEAPASGAIVSLPDDPDASLHRLHLRSGRLPTPTTSAREVLVSRQFAISHGLKPGDDVSAVLNGRLERLRVTGVALSPEYIYIVSPGSVFPEKARYGIFWMHRDVMEAAFDMDGAFNDIVVSLARGASEPDVIDRIDELLSRYGGLGAYGREDQVSHEFVSNEIEQLRGMTLIVPVIFLGVAAFLLNIVISRMIATQREQIATLKALGYTSREIGLHYFQFVMLITVGSVALGTLGGAWMGHGMTVLYVEFFDFPSFEYLLRPRVVMLGFLVSAFASTLGIARALHVAMRLPPAEAMRPQAPPSYRPTLFERVGLHRLVSPAIRMVVRDLERRKVRTVFSILGVALATSILVVGRFSEDAIDFLLDFQYHRVQQYDVDVALTEETDGRALSTLRHVPGVLAVEPYRRLPVRLRAGHLDRRLAITGLSSSNGLHRLLDIEGRTVPLPNVGLVLSATLASSLEVEIGDLVTIDVLEGRRPSLRTEVTGLIDDFSGLSAYMDLDEMNRLMEQPHSIGGAFLLVDSSRSTALYHDLDEMPRVVTVSVKDATIRNFKETIARNLDLMRPFLVGFSSIIAIGVVYNGARISLSERSRDLATLRILGYTKREVAMIQLGELGIVTAIAIPVGLLGGYGLARLTAEASSSELVRIPFVISPATFAFASIVILVATFASGLLVLWKVRGLDLVSVLKSREE